MTLAPGAEITLRIDRLSVGGRGVGRLNGVAIHVDGTAPGDVIRARLIRLTGAHAEADLIRVEEASSDRVTPRCPHVGTCGGCRWQHLDDLAQALHREVPGITGLVWAVNASQSDAVEVSAVSVLDGRPFIYERLGGLTFKLGLLTFFQTNTTQAERMLEVVREFAGLRGTEQVLDLYCGVGTFALALAGQAAQVTGIEALQAATEAARDNAALNTITNALFYTAPADHLRWVLAPQGHPDVVVLDPPRAGAGIGVTREIGTLAPRRVVYVSSNPLTLASAELVLRTRAYQVTAIQPVDLFPHTDHVECVVQLERTVER